MIHDSEILDDHMDAGSDTGLGAVQVTNDGFVKKVLVSFPKQVMVLQNEVAEELTWPPRPVIEGETFRISRSSSGIRKGVAHTPVQKHWPEENSMSEELKSAESYGTVLKAREKRMTEMVNKQKQRLLIMLSFRPGITHKSLDQVKAEKESRLNSIKRYQSPLKVKKIKRRKKIKVRRKPYVVSEPTKRIVTQSSKNKINDNKNMIMGITEGETDVKQYKVTVTRSKIKTGDFKIDLMNTSPRDLEWEMTKPSIKDTLMGKKKYTKRPSSAPATKLKHSKTPGLLEDWSKELGSPGFKTIGNDDSLMLKKSIKSGRSKPNLSMNQIRKGSPQRKNNNHIDIEGAVSELERQRIYGNASELNITSPTRKAAQIKRAVSKSESANESKEEKEVSLSNDDNKNPLKDIIGNVENPANEQKEEDTQPIDVNNSVIISNNIAEDDYIKKEGSSILLPWDHSDATLVQEGMKISRQRSKGSGERLKMDPKTKKMNPMYKLDSDPKPIRMPIGNLNDMVLGPSKQAIMEYEKEVMRLKLLYMLKENKKAISTSEEKLIQDEVYSKQQEKELKAHMLALKRSTKNTNSKLETTKHSNNKKRSRDSIFHPVDTLRKSRSASHIGNKYTVPIPAIKRDKSPVVGFGYRRKLGMSTSATMKNNHAGGPMELVRSLSRQSRKSSQSRERMAPPQGWERHVHIDGSDFFVNKVTREASRKLPSAN